MIAAAVQKLQKKKKELIHESGLRFCSSAH